MGRKPALTKDQVDRAKGSKTSDISTLADEWGVSRMTVRRAMKGDIPIRSTERAAAKGSSVPSPYTELGVSGLDRYNVAKDEYLRDWQTADRVVSTVKRMLDHPTVSAIAFAVEMSLRSAKGSVKRVSDDTADVEAADFLRSCLDDMSHSLDDHLSQAISMVWYGFAPFEMVFKRRLGPRKDPESKYDDGLVGWRKFAYRSPDTLAFGQEWEIDENGGIQGMNQLAPPDFKPRFIPISKMLLYRTTVQKNSPQGRSVLRGVYAPWYFSKNLTEIEAISAERMGSGFPVVYLGEDTSKGGTNSDFAKAQKLVRNVRVDEQFGAVFPYPKMGQGAREGKGILFELVTPPSRGAVDFNQIIERNNKQIAQALLAQFIFYGLSERGTQALAVRATDFFTTAISGWLTVVADTVNRYAVPKLFGLNLGKFGGLTKYPALEFSDIGQIDIARFVEAISKAANAGVVRVDAGIEDAVRRTLELPERDPNAPPPEPRVPPGTQPGAPTPNDAAEWPNQHQELVPSQRQADAETQAAMKTIVDWLSAEAGGKEQFQRGTGAGKRRAWEQETNAFEAELQRTYEDWAEGVSRDLSLAEDAEDEQRIMDEALATLSATLLRAGRQGVVSGGQLGLGDAMPSPGFLQQLADRAAGWDDLVTSSLVPDLRARLEGALRDGDVRMTGAIGILGALVGLQGRLGSFAGSMWSAIQSGLVEQAKQADESGTGGRVAWQRDAKAKHCTDCELYGADEFPGRVYESWEEMSAATGNRLPGEVLCDGNCRCSLWVEMEGEWVRA